MPTSGNIVIHGLWIKFRIKFKPAPFEFKQLFFSLKHSVKLGPIIFHFKLHNTRHIHVQTFTCRMKRTIVREWKKMVPLGKWNRITYLIKTTHPHSYVYFLVHSLFHPTFLTTLHDMMTIDNHHHHRCCRSHLTTCRHYLHVHIFMLGIVFPKSFQ